MVKAAVGRGDGRMTAEATGADRMIAGRGALAGLRRFAAVAGGKSGLLRARWWVTPTGREVRDSATESKPPVGFRPRG